MWREKTDAGVSVQLLALLDRRAVLGGSYRSQS